MLYWKLAFELIEGEACMGCFILHQLFHDLCLPGHAREDLLVACRLAPSLPAGSSSEF